MGTRRLLAALAVVAACGDDASSPDAQESPADAAVPPDADPCAGVVCDDRDPCTADGCDSTGSCTNVSLDRCAMPTCSLGACAGPDTDGDGLSDAWETQGYVDIDCDGGFDAAADLELPGAHVDELDVYLEYDYMAKPGAGNACATSADCLVAGERCVANVCVHTHDLDPTALQLVIDAFSAHGVHLHVDPVHDALPETTRIGLNGCGADAASLAALKTTYFDPRRRWVYRYGVLGHGACASHYGDEGVGSAGEPEYFGNDFIVSLGYRYFELGLPESAQSSAVSFMHHLGHTLDLREGGEWLAGGYRPNYLSVMGHAFQHTGIPYTAAAGTVAPIIGYRVDFSDEILPTLDESQLDEVVGIGAGTTDVTFFFDEDTFELVAAPASGPIDWDVDGQIDASPVSRDVTGDAADVYPAQGWSDWPAGSCTADADCPSRPPDYVEHVRCVNERCTAMRVDFQCSYEGMQD
jgi:hypothetical protein